MRPLHVNQVRQGEFGMLVREMRSIDPEKHHQYFRMSTAKVLVARRISKIAHQRTHQAPISVDERLAVTLRYLATGASQVSVAASYRLAGCTVSKRLAMPPPATLPGTGMVNAHAFVGDAAFPLHQNLMRPYPGKYSSSS